MPPKRRNSILKQPHTEPQDDIDNTDFRRRRVSFHREKFVQHYDKVDDKMIDSPKKEALNEISASTDGSKMSLSGMPTPSRDDTTRQLFGASTAEESMDQSHLQRFLNESEAANATSNIFLQPPQSGTSLRFFHDSVNMSVDTTMPMEGKLRADVMNSSQASFSGHNTTDLSFADMNKTAYLFGAADSSCARQPKKLDFDGAVIDKTTQLFGSQEQDPVDSSFINKTMDLFQHEKTTRANMTMDMSISETTVTSRSSQGTPKTVVSYERTHVKITSVESGIDKNDWDGFDGADRTDALWTDRQATPKKDNNSGEMSINEDLHMQPEMQRNVEGPTLHDDSDTTTEVVYGRSQPKIEENEEVSMVLNDSESTETMSASKTSQGTPMAVPHKRSRCFDGSQTKAVDTTLRNDSIQPQQAQDAPADENTMDVSEAIAGKTGNITPAVDAEQKEDKPDVDRSMLSTSQPSIGKEREVETRIGDDEEDERDQLELAESVNAINMSRLFDDNQTDARNVTVCNDTLPVRQTQEITTHEEPMDVPEFVVETTVNTTHDVEAQQKKINPKKDRSMLSASQRSIGKEPEKEETLSVDEMLRAEDEARREAYRRRLAKFDAKPGPDIAKLEERVLRLKVEMAKRAEYDKKLIAHATEVRANYRAARDREAQYKKNEAAFRADAYDIFYGKKEARPSTSDA
ncbi:unnamed protein product, partial [Mesorhabditis spiculigera]